MEAFKAYLKKEYPHLNDGDAMFAWDIWRAALGFVKEKLECEIKPGDIEYFIDKELKED